MIKRYTKKAVDHIEIFFNCWFLTTDIISSSIFLSLQPMICSFDIIYGGKFCNGSFIIDVMVLRRGSEGFCDDKKRDNGWRLLKI